MFELKVMEPAAFKFDYIATQAGQSSAGMPEFCPDPKCCPWQHFGSVACSVAWVLRVVCSVACGGCHVAYFASCSAVCR